MIELAVKRMALESAYLNRIGVKTVVFTKSRTRNKPYTRTNMVLSAMGARR